ncbi:MBL fold metallo-hydrolase [bacterium]|nr:MBL fold metallo-hydrolase [bacterium]
MIKVSFLDVGQGDSIVITTPNPEVAYLVDIKHERTVNDYLEENDINCLAAIFITHSDEDHISGINYLLNNWGSEESFNPKTIKGFYINPDRYYVIETRADAEENGQLVEEQPGKKNRYLQLLNSIYERMPSYGCRMEYLTDKKGPFYYDAMKITVLHPPEDFSIFWGYRDDRNEASAVLRVEYGNRAILLTADIQLVAISMLLQKDDVELSADVLKFPHHGAWPDDIEGLSSHCTMAKFLGKVDPKYVILSVGTRQKAKYFHVRPEVFYALNKLRNSGRLQRFLCAEATRTCLLEHPTQIIDGKEVVNEIPCDAISQVRNTLPKEYLSNFANKETEACPCAGTITIEIDTQGAIDVLPTTDAHKLVIDKIPFAKCAVD